LNHYSDCNTIEPEEERLIEIKDVRVASEKFAQNQVDNQTILKQSLLAVQIAHDIRSPLSALQMATKYVAHFPEKERVIVRNAIQQMNDVANNLLNRYKQNANGDSTDQVCPELIFVIIENILSEKRYEYKEHPT